MKIPVEKVERIVLSHWHSDHSGGILAFLRLRREAAAKVSDTKPCVVDLHPDRPIARGIAPNRGAIIGRLAPDPTFEQVQELGGVVDKHADGHTVAEGTVWVSGEIPRVTEYETGILGGVRWIQEENLGKGGWIPEEVSLCNVARLERKSTDEITQEIMDERYAAIDVIGKGLVIFSS